MDYLAKKLAAFATNRELVTSNRQKAKKQVI
jgi:hypothetical protein